jgi:hypothetical protein
MSEYFTTVLIPLNVKNLKGRMYKDNKNLRESIDKFNEKTKQTGSSLGEFFINSSYNNFYEVSFSNVTHSMKNVRIDGENVIGDIRILNTPFTKSLSQDFNLQEMLYRPRVLGVTNKDGLVTIKSLFTFDIVENDIDNFYEYESDTK